METNPRFVERMADNCIGWMRTYGPEQGRVEIDKRLGHLDLALERKLIKVLKGKTNGDG